MIKLQLDINEIDYGSLLDLLLSYVDFKELNLPATIKKLAVMPQTADALKGFLHLMPQSKQDEIVSSIVNANSEKIGKCVEKMLAKKGVEIQVSNAIMLCNK